MALPTRFGPTSCHIVAHSSPITNPTSYFNSSLSPLINNSIFAGTMDTRTIHRPHVISSLNPAWCLMPTSGKKCGSRRISDDPAALSMRACPRFLSAADCPASPKIGCMGQITRSRSRKLSLPFTPTTTNKTHSKKFKFSRLLSGRSLLTPSPKATIRDEDDGTRIRRVMSQRSTMRVGEEMCVADMDPPLPVVRRSVDRDGEQGSIWSRRQCGGQALGGLQLQKQQLSFNRPTI